MNVAGESGGGLEKGGSGPNTLLVQSMSRSQALHFPLKSSIQTQHSLRILNLSSEIITRQTGLKAAVCSRPICTQ